MSFSSHLAILPIVLPLATGALMLLFDERRQILKGFISLVATVILVACALLLLATVAAGAPVVYRLGDWPAPYAIVLVADRLAAALVLLTSVLGLAAVPFSFARWQRAGPRFHALVQFLLMGVNGAFLTGDLFNLFVFFEVLLLASYGLALHGSGVGRVRASLPSIVINLLASLLFLIGATLLYGVTGTLNMADIAARAAALAAGDRALFDTGLAVLGVAFLVKAGMWPLGLWLPGAYSAASAPAAALFAVLTKVGVYVVLRTSTLFLPDAEGGIGEHVATVLMAGGQVTLAFGAIGVLASQQLSRVAAYSLLVSAGTLLAAVSLGDARVSGAALYYLVVSTLAISALFLMNDLLERGRAPGADIIAVSMEAFVEPEDELEPDEQVGVAIPGTLALLGTSFVICALVVAGMPPLAGFIGKFALLDAIFDASSLTLATWLLVVLLLGSGLASIIGLGRAGTRRFWASSEETLPRVLVVEVAPIVMLLSLCAVLTIFAGSALQYFDDAARALHDPHRYIKPVLSLP